MAKPPDINVQASFPKLQSIYPPKETANNSSNLENSHHLQMAAQNFFAVNSSPAMDKLTDKNTQGLLAKVTPTSTTSSSHQFTNFGNQFGPSQISYAGAVQGKQRVFNGLQGVLGYDKLPPRRRMKVENKTAVLFSSLEINAANSKLRHSMVLKFSTGRPTLLQIHEHIKQNWKLNGEFIVSLIDPRHVGVYISNEDDLRLALSKESHMINKCMYRAFRWTPEFNLNVENPVVAVWIRLPGIPWPFYNGAMLECIGNEIGKFLKVDNRTLALTNQLFARLCVEVDVSKPLETEIWIGESKEVGFWQKVVYEGNIAYCSGCGLLGHSIGVCRKARTRNVNPRINDIGEQQRKADGKKPMVNKEENSWDRTNQEWMIKKNVDSSSSKEDNHGVNIEESIKKNPTVDNVTNATEEINEKSVENVAEDSDQKKDGFQIDLDNGSGEVLSDEQLYDKEKGEMKRKGKKEISRVIDEVKIQHQQQHNQNTPEQVVRKHLNTEQIGNEHGMEDSGKIAKISDEFVENDMQQQQQQLPQFYKPTTEEQHQLLSEKDAIGLSEEEIRYNSILEAEKSVEKQNKEEIEHLGPCTLNKENECHSSSEYGSPLDGKEIEEESNAKEVEEKSNEILNEDSEEDFQLYVGKNTRKKKGNGVGRPRGGRKKA